MPDDIVVFSSSPIPGNRASINRIINKLYLKGVKVYTNTELSDIHTSGHAKQEEQKRAELSGCFLKVKKFFSSF